MAGRPPVLLDVGVQGAYHLPRAPFVEQLRVLLEERGGGSIAFEEESAHSAVIDGVIEPLRVGIWIEDRDGARDAVGKRESAPTLVFQQLLCVLVHGVHTRWRPTRCLMES